MLELTEHFPMFSIFIFVLLISCSFLVQLFPCRLQYELNENIYLKHLFALFTMFFFVILLAPLEDKRFIVLKSVAMYILFVLITKVEYKIFILIIVLLFISYIVVLQKELQKKKNETLEEHERRETKMYDQINLVVYFIVIILILIGVAIFMGEKKMEYKNKFNYITFFFGKVKCAKNLQKHTYSNALKHLFD